MLDTSNSDSEAEGDDDYNEYVDFNLIFTKLLDLTMTLLLFLARRIL